MKKILCESNPMCYGSSTVLLSIMEQLSNRTICLAYGVAKEILSKSSSELIEVNNKSSDDVKNAIENIDFDIVLVVSNTSNLQLYKSLNKKIVFVHIHYFFPNAHLNILDDVDCLFVQNFWNLQQSSKNVIKVGVLIKQINSIERNKKEIILVNLGGGESRFIKPGVNSDYGLMMLNLLIHLKPFFSNKEIIVCGGTKIIDTILTKAKAHNIQALTLSNEDYLNLLNKAELLISAPGLNAIFEAIYRDIPILFLPPQNISQVYQLNEYENAGLCKKGLNLTIPNCFVSEEIQTEIFLTEMSNKYNDPNIIQFQLDKLLNQLEYTKSKEYSDKIESARIYLGEIGTNTISKFINNVYKQ
jgi:spore coat polysaccharide biosynthesis predicted glycosyltransferase SpsG